MHTHFRAFLKIYYKNLSFHLSPLGKGVWDSDFEKRQKICPPETVGRDIAIKMLVKQRSCPNRSSFFFGVAIQINCSIPYKSAKNIDFLLSLLYNYTVFYIYPKVRAKNGFECRTLVLYEGDLRIPWCQPGHGARMD